MFMIFKQSKTLIKIKEKKQQQNKTKQNKTERQRLKDKQNRLNKR